MKIKAYDNPKRIDEISKQIGGQAADLFASRQLWCAPALLVSVNRGLSGELSDDLAIRLSAGFGEGIGGSGCLCGSISGGIQALGLFLGNGRRSASGDKTVQKVAQRLHQAFNHRFGSTCCRVLIKDLKRGSTEHFRVCAQRTAFAAEYTACMILDQRPELFHYINWQFLNKNKNRAVARLIAAARSLTSVK